MAKEIVYFNATKQIETITIHYNKKLDGGFVDEVSQHIKEIAKKMSKVDLKNPKEFYTIQVFVYPSKQLFFKVFAGEIEKRFYSRKRSHEDLYVVRDSDGNIHIVSPRGMGVEKAESFKKILVIKVLGEYMDDKQKQSAERLLKEAMEPKKQDQEEEVIEEEEIVEDVPEQEELALDDNDQELEEDVLGELQAEDLEEDELSDEALEDIIQAEVAIENIDEVQAKEKAETTKSDIEEEKEEQQDKEKTKDDAKVWLNVGWLAYLSGKLKKKKDIERFAAHVSKNGVKKLNQLSSNKLFENYNYSKEYACALVAYIVETYGTKKFVQFYENPKDIEGVFGVPKRVFNSGVKAFIYRQYTDKQMKMDMDEKGLDEITEVHFVKGGGAEIKTDKEVEEPTIKEKV